MDYQLSQLSGDVLLGIVNEQLRLHCHDREALYYELDIASELLEQKLSEAGFSYDPISNQFKGTG